jgi:nicotinamide-nucleotide amidase
MPDLTSLAASVGGLLKEKQHTIAVSESSCGGLISAALVAVPGASAYYHGGTVIYTQISRQGILNITEAEMTGMRASTEQYAMLTARKIRARLGTIWALSETGASGPTGNRYGDDAGHACFAVVGPVERSMTLETGGSDREVNMWAFAESALAFLEECIKAS